MVYSVIAVQLISSMTGLVDYSDTVYRNGFPSLALKDVGLTSGDHID